MTTKDAFNKDITLDSDGKVILQKERTTLRKDETTQLPIEKVIKMDTSEETSQYVTNIYHQTNIIMKSSPYANYNLPPMPITNLSILIQTLKQIQIILKSIKHFAISILHNLL